jgi:hypothetical protein
VFQQDFYWPTAVVDAKSIVRSCKGCQIANAPPIVGTPDHPPHMAFRCMGARHGRTAEESTRGFTHLLVAIDKFSKWIEA